MQKTVLKDDAALADLRTAQLTAEGCGTAKCDGSFYSVSADNYQHQTSERCTVHLCQVCTVVSADLPNASKRHQLAEQSDSCLLPRVLIVLPAPARCQKSCLPAACGLLCFMTAGSWMVKRHSKVVHAKIAVQYMQQETLLLTRQPVKTSLYQQTPQPSAAQRT